MSSVDPEAPEAPAAPDAPAEPTTEPPDAPDPTAEPQDEGEDEHRAILDALAVELGDGLVDSINLRGELLVRVGRDTWKRTAEVLRHQLGFDYFCFLSGIDWMAHTWPNPKVVEGEDAEDAEEAEPEAPTTGGKPEGGWETGVAGGESRFQVLARVYSTSRKAGITLKVDLDDDSPQIETWSQVYAGADWHERETWEMYGFEFVGHPNLIHLYLPSGFEGFPLRKDFPLLSREVKPWPGLVDVEGFPAGYSDGAEESSGDGAES